MSNDYKTEGDKQAERSIQFTPEERAGCRGCQAHRHVIEMLTRDITELKARIHAWQVPSTSPAAEMERKIRGEVSDELARAKAFRERKYDELAHLARKAGVEFEWVDFDDPDKSGEYLEGLE